MLYAGGQIDLISCLEQVANADLGHVHNALIAASTGHISHDSQTGHSSFMVRMDIG